MTATIEAEGLVKRYGELAALDGFSLAVPEGTILGVLGPNGAGKTTAVRILATLLKLDAGRATVAGHDVSREPDAVRRKIGLSGQSAAVDEYLTGHENLTMVGELYGMKRKAALARATELLAQFSLSDAGDRMTRTYSGGMRRRLDLAAALVARPPVLVLDEPTTGLDPRSRNDLWDVIRTLVADGATLLLTTQYLEEADQLADDIIVMDRGKAIAQGTADDLKAQVGGERVEVTVADPADLERAKSIVGRFALGDIVVGPQGRSLTASVASGALALRDALGEFHEEGIGLLDFGLRRPTLDDVFLTLTGHKAEETTTGADAETGRPAVTQEARA